MNTSNDMDTTNISDLPIIPNNPPNNSEELMENMNLNKNNVMIDNKVLQPKELNKKNVTFNENVQYDTEQKQKLKQNKTIQQGFHFKIEYKVIIFATFLFFIFNDIKFRKYILNILVQIFGSFLKTETNQMTLLGMLFYSIFYGLILLLLVTFIDLTSLQLLL